MRTVIVFNHPYEGSYCRAILDAVSRGLGQAGHEIDVMHLDRDGFQPAMTTADLQGFIEHRAVDPQVIDYQERLKRADRLVFIFPIWWDLMPAATKGFVDRVLSPGVAYDHHPRGFGLVPLLRNLRSITVITTMNKPKWLYRLLIGNLIHRAMLRSVFRTMGYRNLRWISFTSVKSSGDQKRRKWLTELEKKFGSTDFF